MNRYLIVALGILFLASSAHSARLKDIATFKGIRSNQLLGYGLVVGLGGTGDGTNTDYTVRSVINMLERMGIHIEREKIS